MSTEKDAVKEIWILKASGEKELFSCKKLRHSLEKAGTSTELIPKIISHIKSGLKDGMKTRDIYRHAYSLLRKFEATKAGRYAIKNAIMELGPTGFPFEKLVAELLKYQGFSVEVDKIVRGSCVSHEIDVMAQQNERLVLVESKFHNQPGIKTDVKVALYVQARFEDIRKQLLSQSGSEQKQLEAWLVTNTKLTSNAIRYANCVGIRAIGWSYPPDSSLQNLIEAAGLSPLTSLTTLSRNQKRQLLSQGAVLCREINKGMLQSIGISESKASQVLKEANNLCKRQELH